MVGKVVRRGRAMMRGEATRRGRGMRRGEKRREWNDALDTVLEVEWESGRVRKVRQREHATGRRKRRRGEWAPSDATQIS
jgi:hypothetical protein